MTYLALVGAVESQLRELYSIRHENDGVSQTDLANKLGIDKSSVHRKLIGASNLTLQSLADLVWGLDGVIDLEISPVEEQCPSNDAFKNEIFKHVKHSSEAIAKTPKTMVFEDQF